MLPKTNKSDLGTIKISDRVIASLASIAALKVQGVHATSGSILDDLYSLIKKESGKGVKIINNSENDLRLRISIVVKYGVSIPNVAMNVQENIKNAVEGALGVSVSEVDVQIQGVRSDEGGRQ